MITARRRGGGEGGSYASMLHMGPLLHLIFQTRHAYGKKKNKTNDLWVGKYIEAVPAVKGTEANCAPAKLQENIVESGYI